MGKTPINKIAPIVFIGFGCEPCSWHQGWLYFLILAGPLISAIIALMVQPTMLFAAREKFLAAFGSPSASR